jgi:hypothetical protein
MFDLRNRNNHIYFAGDHGFSAAEQGCKEPFGCLLCRGLFYIFSPKLKGVLILIG